MIPSSADGAKTARESARAKVARSQTPKPLSRRDRRLLPIIRRCSRGEEGWCFLADCRPAEMLGVKYDPKRKESKSVQRSRRKLLDEQLIEEQKRGRGGRARVHMRPTADSDPTSVSGQDQEVSDQVSEDEFDRLMKATKDGPPRNKIAGESRVMLYLTAAYVGLRGRELSSLTPQSFDLAVRQPTVTVNADYSKHRRRDLLPLHPGLAALLRTWLKDKPADGRLWPGPWAEVKAGGKMLKGDLAATREAWIKEAETDHAEMERRKKSDFLLYRNGAGLVVEFHALGTPTRATLPGPALPGR